MLLSLDVGQTADPSALAAIDVSRKVERDDERREQTVAMSTVRGLHRYPLRTSYIEIVEDTCERKAKLEADRGEEVTLLLDATGVGRAVWELFTERGVHPIGITITGGDKVTQGPDGFWRVPKKELATALAVAMQNDRLRVVKHLKLAGLFAEEARNFRLKHTAAGNERFEHRDGEHDDMVLAVAQGVWWANLTTPPTWEKKADKNPAKERRRQRVLAEMGRQWWRGPKARWAR